MNTAESNNSLIQTFRYVPNSLIQMLTYHVFHSWFPNSSGGVHGYGQAPSSRNDGGGGGGGGGRPGGFRAFGGAGNRLGN